MIDFLIGYLCQILLTVGIIALFGLIIAGLRRLFCSICGRSGPTLLLITGLVGTPIHELSHALMCVLFGHKITEIKLYQPNSNSGTLGYVTHTYNRKNIYHQIGNFFIGTAPITVGCGVLMLIMGLLTPDAFDMMISDAESISTIGDFLPFISTVLEELFVSGVEEWKTWVFLVLAIMIASHMEMSGADIKGSLGGLGILSLLWLVVSGAIFLISSSVFEDMTVLFTSFAFVLSAFFSIAIIFLVILVLFALLIKLITAPFRR